MSYGVLWIGASGGPPIAAPVVSPDMSAVVHGGEIAGIFVGIEGMLSLPRTLTIGTDASLFVGQHC